jgi:hypothetical protein
MIEIERTGAGDILTFQVIVRDERARPGTR